MCTCVSFLNQHQQLYFGRNLDVSSSYGETVMITPRNYNFPFKHLPNIQTTKAIIGMGICDKTYPLYFDAANENGLCIANLNFPTFAYYHPHPIPNKINLTSYEFMMWVLQNFDTVAQLLPILQDVVFIDTPLHNQMPTVPAHWMISDAHQTIVVEPTKQGIKIYNNPVNVLTNNPSFDWHLMNLHQYVGIQPNSKDSINWNDYTLKPLGVGTGSFALPGDYTPQSRFIKASYVNTHYPTVESEEENIYRMFTTLAQVSMPLGCVQDEISVYSSCYSTKTKTYYYQRCHQPILQQITLDERWIHYPTIKLF